MGYRSDVAYTIRFNSDDDTLNKQSFYTFLAEAKSKEECALALEDVCMHIDEVRYRLDFYTDSVKWYDEYEDVRAHTELIHLANSYCDTTANPCIGYIFIRTGEELNDIEEDYGGNYDLDWLSVTRSIVRDWS